MTRRAIAMIGMIAGLVVTGQTLFAAAKESTRYAFNGVLLTAAAKKVNLVSTDGRRLAMARAEPNGKRSRTKPALPPEPTAADQGKPCEHA